MTQSIRSYAEAWHVHKIRDRQFWGALLAWPFVTAGIGSVVGSALGISSAIPIVGALWMIVMAVTAERNREFRCPRCGDKFYGREYRRGWGSTRQCRHCGLRKWAEVDAPAA